MAAHASLPMQVDRIGGRRAEPAELLGTWLCDPSTAEQLQPQRATDDDALSDALSCAAAQHGSRDWADLAPEDRAEALDAIALELDRRAAQVAVAESRCNGVVLNHTQLFAASFGDTFRGVADLIRSAAVQRALPAAQGPVRLHRVPWGPALVLVPWNAPAGVAVGKIANALGAGCPVLLKPSERAPLSCNVIADAIEAVGLPRGTFQLVHGGAKQGARLVDDPRVRVVSFTGGVAAGRQIARQAAENFKQVQLELGGSNPAIVRADADLDATATALADGITKLNGQWCEAPRRLLVDASIEDDLATALISALSRIRVGPALDPDSAMGPIANERHFRHLQRELDRLSSVGGRIHTTAVVPDEAGWWMSPTVVRGVDNRHCLDEVFGPVVTLHPVRDDEEAVLLANAADSGLAGYVFSRDIDAALRLGARLHAGEVKVNGTSLLDMSPESTQSFWGTSGVGGHGRMQVFDLFLGSRIVGVDVAGAPV